MMQHFKFEREKGDVVNEKTGKVLEYKVTHSIGKSEEHARELARIGEEYRLVAIFQLSKYW